MAPPLRPDPVRRRLLQTIPGLAVASLLPRFGAAASGRLGIAYTSFVARLRPPAPAADGARPAPSLSASAFVDLCRSFGADGGQVDFEQLDSTEPAYLAEVKRRCTEAGLFLELSVDGKVLEDEDRYAPMATAARALGVSRIRIALLRGRRYETFHGADDWGAFATHWRETIPRAKAMIERHRIPVGIENHKDWTTDELVDLLKSVGSPLVGACVDFGNNLAFLEDPLRTAEKLAPFAITTHLKDMAVRPYEHGFELSEVPLGTGILPLAKMVAALRKGRPDLPLCLEMMTRDPLLVPYKDDAYWAPFGKRDEARIKNFETTILSKAWPKPLPRVTGLEPAARLAAEDDNVKKCLAYARAHLERT